ncbi:PAS domain S-box protein [Deinococcus marmoris]|uniref:Diguanylate cyclase/phosphodiesterase (GGDEF & EAL domains) with PAS/PAC sensor(S) n=1 Tax=Deinococcus marmoris TaxID=249408 RepID=A0A1U7NXC3_9DEIO|nr:PAS domain S-box protein [Deinococcus marmoris]OLV17571.1 diguanylate cyclase/phosphodiesterase (GGDEF & EAL domains) with PAS/PAC sensor(s) [Deinococcus marmoris]
MESQHAFHPGSRLLSYALDACVIGVIITDAQQADYPMVYVNPAFERLTGYPAAELIGRNPRFLQGKDRDQEASREIRTALAAGQGLTTVLRNYRKDGTRFLNELTISPLYDAAGNLTHHLGFQTDATLLEKARQAEALAREQMTATLGRMTDGFLSLDPNWNVTYVNPAAARISNRRPEDFVGQNLFTLFPEYSGLGIGQAIQQAAASGIPQSAVSYLPALERWIELTGYPGDDGMSLFTRDVTESQQAQRERQASEERFSRVFQTSPVAIFITRQRDRRFIEVNDEFLRQSGYARDEILGRSSQDLGFWNDRAERQTFWNMVDDNLQIHSREVAFRNRAGDESCGVLSTIPTEVAGETCVIGFVRDITQEKQARQQLEASEQRAQHNAVALQHTLDLSLDLITSIGSDNCFAAVSAASHRMLGYAPEKMIGQPIMDFIHPADRDMTAAEAQRIRSGHATTTFQNRLLHQDGRVIWLEWSAVVLPGDGIIYSVGRDITQRRAAEEDQAFLAALVQASRNAIIGLSLEGTIRSWNPGAEKLYGYAAEEVIGQPVTFLVPAELQAQEVEMLERASQGERVPPFEGWRVTRSGQQVLVLVTIAPVLDAAGQVIGVSKITHDITSLRSAEREIQTLNEDLQRQLRHVTGLREIDQSIAASADLSVTLGLVLDHIRNQLGTDVATILLLDSQRETLEYAVTRGFHATRLEGSEMRLGVGLAGQVALTRQPLALPDLSSAAVLPAWRDILQREKLAAYYGVPLVVKGQVVGVVEVLHHQAWPQSLDWTTTLETLVSQAAIAIDNAWLVNELERSNLELRSAYDETIEGWARAMDLRDRETEGHSRRVTEMTVELCQALGFTPEQLIDVRRGALLHDMGKMGIPDAVLLKPGALTDEEWTLMKKHPTYAEDLLSPIEFLRPALDIPRYHHEKWDGSGYPVGLAADAIPLAARAFAVVDVYDALTSDRPYRQAWTREQTMTHLQASSGTHFDPEVVDVFIQMMRKP